MTKTPQEYMREAEEAAKRIYGETEPYAKGYALQAETLAALAAAQAEIDYWQDKKQREREEALARSRRS